MNKVLSLYDVLQYHESDKTTLNWPMLGSPVPIWTITLMYTVFVFFWGPHHMKNRAPYNIKRWMHLYNVLQIVLNLYVFVCGVKLIFYNQPGYDFGCTVPLAEDHPYRSEELFLFYGYYLIKISDYFDTIFFVLRKNFRQVTVLHCYHHIIMVIGSYYYVRSQGGGPTWSILLLNTFVHVIMYGYYLFTSLKPSSESSRWWKKYITHIQLAQFLLIIIHNVYPLLFRKNCQVSTFWSLFNIVQTSIVMILFINFYIKSYLKSVTKRTD